MCLVFDLLLVQSYYNNHATYVVIPLHSKIQGLTNYYNFTTFTGEL